MLNILRRIKQHYTFLGNNAWPFISKLKSPKNTLIGVTPKGIKHPILLRSRTEDVPMFYHVFYNLEFDVQLDFEPRVIIDCGSHIGLSAAFFANKYPNAKIICLEPEKENYDLLLKNTRLYPNVICLLKGVWNRNTNLEILDNGFGNWGFMTKEVEYNNEKTISAISIDQILKDYNIEQIDICKINIEGSEKELFEKNYDQWVPKTKAIIIELHDRMKEGCSKSFFKAMVNYDFYLSHKGSYLTTVLQ